MSEVYLTEFAQDLHALIEKHINNGVPPEDLVDELVRQCSSTFGKYNIEYIRRVEGEGLT